jgi:hypothetical protein
MPRAEDESSDGALQAGMLHTRILYESPAASRRFGKRWVDDGEVY